MGFVDDMFLLFYYLALFVPLEIYVCMCLCLPSSPCRTSIRLVVMSGPETSSLDSQYPRGLKEGRMIPVGLSVQSAPSVRHEIASFRQLTRRRDR